MKPRHIGTVVAFSLAANATIARGQGAATKKPVTTSATAGASVVAPMVPGGAVISALVTVTPVGGGPAKTSPVDAKGAFALAGLAPGRYKVALTTPKQTQGATFGEKVTAGLQSAGSAVAQGAKVNPNSMPSRLSMNVTVARKSYVLEVDGASVEMDVGADGKLAGQVTAK